MPGKAKSPKGPKKFKADMFVNGKKAQDPEDRIVYDRKTGSLYYDQDGTGSQAQVKIATLGNKAPVWRSGVGVDAQGALVYAGGPALTVLSLAKTLQWLKDPE